MNICTVVTLDKRIIISNTDPEVETITARMTKRMLSEALRMIYLYNEPNKDGDDAYDELFDAYFELTGRMWEMPR